MGNKKTWQRPKQRLLGKESTRTLNFADCMSSLFKKISRKPAKLMKLSKLMSLIQKQILIKVSAESQFG